MDILNIGPETPPLGGTTIPNRLFIKFLRQHEYNFESIDTSKLRIENNSFFAIIYILISIIRTRQKNIIYHVSDNSVLVAPVMVLICALLRKKIIIRFFGGNLYDSMKNNIARRLLIKCTMILASHNFVETKSLTSIFSSVTKNVSQWPNPRDVSSELSQQAKFPTEKDSYLFVGALTNAKGVERLAKIAADTCQKIVFIGEGPSENMLKDSNYCECLGLLPRTLVLRRLLSSKALILPTSHYGEGQAGVIVEALQLGVPVITFDVGGTSDFLHCDHCIILDPEDWAGIKSVLSSAAFDVPTLKYEGTFSRTNFADDIHEQVLKRIDV